MACLRWIRIYKVNWPILVNPVCSRGPRTIESISKRLFLIWKKLIFKDFWVLTFLGRREGVSKKRPKDVSRGKIDL